MITYYAHNADVYCEPCTLRITRDLREQGVTPSGDTDRWPQPVLQRDEADSPLHCGSGSDCELAEELTDGTRVGVFLDNELTPDGVEYVIEALRSYVEDGHGHPDVLRMWLSKVHEYDLTDEQQQVVERFMETAPAAVTPKR